MNNIKTIKNKKELKNVFNFISKTFYEDAKVHNEHYYTMGERFYEMEKQLEEDNDFIMYITEKDKILAALTGKNIDKEHKKITMGVLAVEKAYRKQGYAKKLIKEFETSCIKKGIKHIELGARFRACPLYINLGYKPFLMVQVYDFITINEIRKANTFQLEEKSSYQSDTYGFIIFKVDKVKKEYVNYFEKNVKTSYVEYIFEKDL